MKIGNKSVQRLETIKKIQNYLFGLGALGFLISAIINLIDAPKDSKFLAVVILLVGLAVIAVLWYILYLIIDCISCWRSENLEYLNARLDNLDKNKRKNSKEEE